MKHPAHRAPREYRFAVWTEEEPAEDRVDLRVSLTLLEAMQKPRPEPDGSTVIRKALRSPFTGIQFLLCIVRAILNRISRHVARAIADGDRFRFQDPHQSADQ